MEKITIDGLQENFDDYIKRVENGESFIVEDSKGRSVVMIPAANDDIVKIHTDLNNDAS